MNEQALELFRRACGLNAPLSLDCEGPNGSSATTSLFDSPFVLIGRHPRSDLILDDDQVSRRHAILQVVAGQLFVFDLQSRTKIYWDGEEAPRSQGWLDYARSITIGPYRIRRGSCHSSAEILSDRSSVLSPMHDDRTDAGSPPRAALELPIRMVNGPAQWPIVGWIALVGRSDPCQLVLTDDSISKFHAILVRTPLGVWVVDLLTREGVHVNGQRVRWAWLGDGDAVQFGQFTFIVRYETAPERISRDDVPVEAGADLAHGAKNELAVRDGQSDGGPNILALPSRDRSRGGLQSLTPTTTFVPDTLVPTGGEPWQPAVSHAPTPMLLWQQQMQMMELFHNDMMFMMQMFIAMHGQHLASVRDELAKVQQLTQELARSRPGWAIALDQSMSARRAAAISRRTIAGRASQVLKKSVTASLCPANHRRAAIWRGRSRPQRSAAPGSPSTIPALKWARHHPPPLIGQTRATRHKSTSA